MRVLPAGLEPGRLFPPGVRGRAGSAAGAAGMFLLPGVMAQGHTRDLLSVCVSLSPGGGTGFVGTALTQLLRSRGHQVTHVSRRGGKDRISWVRDESGHGRGNVRGLRSQPVCPGFAWHRMTLPWEVWFLWMFFGAAGCSMGHRLWNGYCCTSKEQNLLCSCLYSANDRKKLAEVLGSLPCLFAGKV